MRKLIEMWINRGKIKDLKLKIEKLEKEVVMSKVAVAQGWAKEWT